MTRGRPDEVRIGDAGAGYADVAPPAGSGSSAVSLSSLPAKEPNK